MSEVEKNRELIRKLYEGYERGEVEPILDAVDDGQVVWKSHGPKDWPWTQKCGCCDDVRGYFDHVLRHVKILEFKPEWTVAGGDSVSCVARVRSQIRGTEQVVEYRVAHFWRLRDGKIVQLTEFYDTASVAMSLGAKLEMPGPQ